MAVQRWRGVAAEVAARAAPGLEALARAGRRRPGSLDVVLGIAADAGSVVLRARRRTIAANLRRLAPQLDRDERGRLLRATFRNFVRCQVDLLAAARGGPRATLDLLDLTGLEHLDRALAQGRGVLAVAAHVGNWELAGLALAALGYPAAAIVEAIDPARDRWLARYRTATGLRLIPHTHGAARAALDVLRAGGVVAVVGDRAIGRSRQHVVPFGSGCRPLPAGPAWLALQAGAPIVPAHVVLTPGGRRRYRGTVEAAVPVSDPGPDPVATITARLGVRLSNIVTAHPDQWFVFQPDWRDGPLV